jgi:hypothetical protein
VPSSHSLLLPTHCSQLHTHLSSLTPMALHNIPWLCVLSSSLRTISNISSQHVPTTLLQLLLTCSGLTLFAPLLLHHHRLAIAHSSPIALASISSLHPHPSLHHLLTSTYAHLLTSFLLQHLLTCPRVTDAPSSHSLLHTISHCCRQYLLITSPPLSPSSLTRAYAHLLTSIPTTASPQVPWCHCCTLITPTVAHLLHTCCTLIALTAAHLSKSSCSCSLFHQPYAW